jgi:hypothetical protein
MLGIVVLVAASVAASATNAVAQTSPKVLANIDKTTTNAYCYPSTRISQKIGPFKSAAFVVVNGWGEAEWKAGNRAFELMVDLKEDDKILSSSQVPKIGAPEGPVRTAVGASFILRQGRSVHLSIINRIGGPGARDGDGCKVKLGIRAHAVTE